MASRSNGSGRRLRLEDFSDRELLALVADHEDGEGWAGSLVVAQAIWPKYGAEEPERARASVARRFSWLRRWGVMEKGNSGLWRLTEDGRLLVEGRLSASQAADLADLGDEQLMSLGYAMADRYQVAGEVPAILFRRAMQFATYRRRR
jgi:hypothetical protein